MAEAIKRTEAKFDCPEFKEGACKILSELLCTRGECGFYPPVAEARKAKIREERALEQGFANEG
ncbi:MAG: hypothetical protein RR394_08630 [Oscillospiraceae bacterium]